MHITEDALQSWYSQIKLTGLNLIIVRLNFFCPTSQLGSVKEDVIITNVKIKTQIKAVFLFYISSVHPNEPLTVIGADVVHVRNKVALEFY